MYKAIIFGCVGIEEKPFLVQKAEKSLKSYHEKSDRIKNVVQKIPGIGGDLVAIANLVQKGRISYAFVGRLLGPKAVQWIKNYQYFFLFLMKRKASQFL